MRTGEWGGSWLGAATQCTAHGWDPQAPSRAAGSAPSPTAAAGSAGRKPRAQPPSPPTPWFAAQTPSTRARGGILGEAAPWGRPQTQRPPRALLPGPPGGPTRQTPCEASTRGHPPQKAPGGHCLTLGGGIRSSEVKWQGQSPERR